ncbi:ATP-binding protein [Aurantimonas sp. VKM B-3413]|uniref:ATP-binding protein n=1 Tax=Aurantimonas sp. VKM B-3413 TaxID=2779401 RepID=UPI001E306B07|nr:sensor histidine kinase [Aurantimonas sp. VKM B-3413]
MSGAVLSTPVVDAANRKNVLILVQLRWIAVVGQILTICVVHFGLGIGLPLLPLSLVVVALVALNLGTLAWLRRRREVASPVLEAAMIFDVLALTLQFALTGGITNPFIPLYLLQVVLGAVLLRPRGTWTLAAVSFAGLIAISFVYRPLLLPHTATGEYALFLRTLALLLCLALDGVLLVVFVTQITRNLRERDAHLAVMRQQAAEEDHIIRMGLLASSAAHELGTPLASLSVILGDWQRVPAIAKDEDLSQELGEMQAAVGRCKSIVTRVLMSAGEARGEAAGLTTLTRFLDTLVAEWRAIRPDANLSYEDFLGSDIAIVSDTTLKQVIFNLLDNAYESPSRWIGLSAERRGEMLRVTVTDQGPGFQQKVLDHFGKPYQSTKGRQGGGIGLFIVVNVVRKLGGNVTARNRPGRGALVALELPLSALAIGDLDHAG